MTPLDSLLLEIYRTGWLLDQLRCRTRGSLLRSDPTTHVYRCVDSSSKLSQRTRPILSHLFVEEFGYSDVDKSTVISVS
jgi:hypothetical protein